MIPKALGSASVRPIILSILARKDSYGYEIIQHAKSLSNGSLDLQPGILYPIPSWLKSFNIEPVGTAYSDPPGSIFAWIDC